MSELLNALVTARGSRITFDKPVIMGILNLTPDSFSDGGSYTNMGAVVRRGEHLVASGAGILDVGGESTRPGARTVTLEEERRRVLPAIEALVHANIGVPISVDTNKAELAEAAVVRGAELINDISALADPKMAQVAAQYGTGLVLMHMRGVPETMQSEPIHYENLLGEVKHYLDLAIEKAVSAGVDRSRIVVDPGIGFGKELEHNLTLSLQATYLKRTGCRVLYAPSRKRFLGELSGRDVGDRDRATAAACALAAFEGADIFRVHNVAAVVDALSVAHAMRGCRR